MRFDWALYLFTLLVAVSAQGIEPWRHLEETGLTTETDANQLFTRKSGGGRGGRAGGGPGRRKGNRGRHVEEIDPTSETDANQLISTLETDANQLFKRKSGGSGRAGGGRGRRKGNRGRHVEEIDPTLETDAHQLVKRKSGGGGRAGGGRGRRKGNRGRHVERIDSTSETDANQLFKRKSGGGGGGARAGGGGGRSNGNKVGGNGNSGNRGSSGNNGGSRPPNAQPGSTAGGTSFSGSGPQPRFGQGGRFYGGGARTPYTAGRSRGGLAAPLLLGGAALAFWPGLWLSSAYMYNYPHHYHYHNKTTDEEENKPVICGCAEDSVCSCEENNSTLKELIGDGSYEGLNKSVIDVAEVNGTTYILVNGTLPKGTTLKDEANNQDQASEDNAAASMRAMAETLGLWPAVAAFAAAVYLV